MTEPEILLQTPRFSVVRKSRTTARGRLEQRETIQHPGAVVILPLLDDGRVCLIRNYRIAVGQRLLELPAGTLEPGEDPQAAAGRELAEETGWQAGHLEPLTRFYMSPGILNENMRAFVATQLQPGRQNLDEAEEIEKLELTWAELLKAVKQGEVLDAKTLAVVLYYDRFCK